MDLVSTCLGALALSYAVKATHLWSMYKDAEDVSRDTLISCVLPMGADFVHMGYRTKKLISEEEKGRGDSGPYDKIKEEII